jgi:hypothetical protein
MHALTLDHSRRAGSSSGSALRSAGGRRLVRAAVRQTARAHPRVRRDRAADPAPRRPVANPGSHYPLPYAGPGPGAWASRCARSFTLRADLPIYLGAEGPKNVALAAEICDGWPRCTTRRFARRCTRTRSRGRSRLPDRAGPRGEHHQRHRGRARAGEAMLGFYIGGMGAKQRNFHKELMARMGSGGGRPDPAALLRGQAGEAIAAVPDQFADEVSRSGRSSASGTGSRSGRAPRSRPSWSRARTRKPCARSRSSSSKARARRNRTASAGHPLSGFTRNVPNG